MLMDFERRTEELVSIKKKDVLCLMKMTPETMERGE
jgi:hypothetical protein